MTKSPTNVSTKFKILQFVMSLKFLCPKKSPGIQKLRASQKRKVSEKIPCFRKTQT